MEHDLKRKIYDQLVLWKNNPNHLPLIVDGLRQVGKSYIVGRFAREHYENVIVFDFRHREELRSVFEGNLDVESIIRKASPYFSDASFVPGKTVLVFEEIGDCLLARTSLKSFALDKRFDVICTGSLLGVLNYRRKRRANIPTGYEQIIHMSSLDFEEFLWACGVKPEQIDELKKATSSLSELPSALASYYKELLKRYVVVGGMPKAVTTFLDTNNYIKSREVLEGLIREYRGDFGRYIDDDGNDKIDYRIQFRLNQLFDSIPMQLARDNGVDKFKFSEVKQGGRASEFEQAFDWLERAGLVLRCFNVNALETPLLANVDKTYFKTMIADIGLLMAMYPVSVSQAFLTDKLESRKGAIYENLVATMLNKAGFALAYFSDGQAHLEIDFLLESSEGMVLVEAKAVNGKTSASKAVMNGETKYHASKCYKVIKENFGIGSYFTSVPQYCLPFLLDDIQEAILKEGKLPAIEFPTV